MNVRGDRGAHLSPGGVPLVTRPSSPNIQLPSGHFHWDGFQHLNLVGLEQTQLLPIGHWFTVTFSTFISCLLGDRHVGVTAGNKTDTVPAS